MKKIINLIFVSAFIKNINSTNEMPFLNLGEPAIPLNEKYDMKNIYKEQCKQKNNIQNHANYDLLQNIISCFHDSKNQ